MIMSNVLLIKKLNLIFVNIMRRRRAITSGRLGPDRRHIGGGVGVTILACLDAHDDASLDVVVLFPMVESSLKPRNPSSPKQTSNPGG